MLSLIRFLFCTRCLVVLLARPSVSQTQDYGSRGNTWTNLTSSERNEVDQFAERFKVMIGAARSELMMVRETIRYAEERGLREWQPGRERPNPGERLYSVNRDRTIVLWVVGRQPLASGIRLVNSHIDSIRLELKPHPLKEQTGVITLDTLSHGGVKGYQWVNVPLALTGRVDRKDGTTVWLDLGLKPGDPDQRHVELDPDDN